MRKFLFLVGLLFPFRLFSQGWVLEYQPGYGNFQLEGVKQMQYDFENAMADIGAQTTESFPGRYIHSGSVGYLLLNHHAGINMAFFTTAGRTNVMDYSGDYTMDFLLKGYRGGLFYRYYSATGIRKLNVYVQISAGVVFSKLRWEEILNVYGDKILDEYMDFTATAAYFEPSAGIRYNLTRTIFLTAGCGYEMDAGGKIRLKRMSYHNLNYEGDDRIHWNGFRCHVGISFNIIN